ncbi:hypothetical protein PIB30_052487 [Stylosanthes scabra]|uniref:Uncharacterized protein n=1 Tax=Stylosanthes scabra TaxID=79078 RepID=A0ABU6SI57_9FABA|nr:hypothetical protein [Stylosanthes scabra]
MTQKSNLFKGQKKNKSIPPNRHGKAPSVRKGKRIVKPSKVTKEMDADRQFVQIVDSCSASTLLKLGGEQVH